MKHWKKNFCPAFNLTFLTSLTLSSDRFCNSISWQKRCSINVRMRKHCYTNMTQAEQGDLQAQRRNLCWSDFKISQSVLWCGATIEAHTLQLAGRYTEGWPPILMKPQSNRRWILILRHAMNSARMRRTKLRKSQIHWSSTELRFSWLKSWRATPFRVSRRRHGWTWPRTFQ